MARHLFSVAIGLVAFAAAPQLLAESMSCSVESAQQGSFQGQNGSTFEIEDFSFDIEQTLNIGSQSSGAGAGKVTFNPFTITKKLDSSSPKLLQAAASGAIFKTMSCSFFAGAGFTPGSAAAPYLTIIFSDAVISRFEIRSAAQGENRGQENLSFDFTKVEFKYSPQ